MKKPSRSWNRRFDDSIPTSRGRQLATLKDAADYIMKLPKAEQNLPEWQTAIACLIGAAEGRDFMMHARIGVLRALNRHVERAFNPDRKDAHWGRRKLKRTNERIGGPMAPAGGSMITISRKGTTRLVFVVGPWALKFARGPRGRRCNRYEADLFRRVDARRREMLCPVRWCADGGWLMVMATAAPLTEAEKEILIDTDGFPDWDYMPGDDSEPFEYKASDWGRFDGRLVAVDYLRHLDQG